MNVVEMRVIVFGVADSVIGKATLPDFCVRSKFLLRPVRKPAFNHLDGTFKGDYRGTQNVKMV